MSDNIEQEPISLVALFFKPEDWTFGITINIWLTIALAVSTVGIIILRWRSGRLIGPNFEIDEAELGFGDQKFKLKPNYTDRQVAYAIWVELSTRKIGLEIDFENDVIAEIYDSWYNYFSVTRELIKGISVSQVQNTSTRAIINLSVDVLNKGLRPHLTRWQARFRRWYERELSRYERSPDDNAIDLQEIQKSFPEYEALKTDMERVNKQLIAYRQKMHMLIYR